MYLIRKILIFLILLKIIIVEVIERDIFISL